MIRTFEAFLEVRAALDAGQVLVVAGRRLFQVEKDVVVVDSGAASFSVDRLEAFEIIREHGGCQAVKIGV